MKNLIIFFFSAIVVVACIYSCKKGGTEDLENNLDAAQFINTSKGVIVRFSENEDLLFRMHLP